MILWLTGYGGVADMPGSAKPQTGTAKLCLAPNHQNICEAHASRCVTPITT
ncbi:MAG: hypothetical protein NC241_00855 [Bacteroides sp.]|nr:hypothetical protein [Bacteroides sp.]